MTDRELLQQVLEALEYAVPFDGSAKTVTKAITALRERLAHCDRCGKKLVGPDHIHTCSPQQPVQEPVAEVKLMVTGGNAGIATRIVEIDDPLRDRLHPGTKLYTAPQPRQWQGLTQEDMPDGDDPVYDDPRFIKGMAWADAVLMKKNGGGV